MDKRLIPILLVILLGIHLISCEESETGIRRTTSPYKNFKKLWEIIDRNYCYFDQKDVDWDQVKVKYKDKLSEEMKTDQLFDTLSVMLDELKDGHVNLSSSFDRSRYWNWYLDYPENFDYSLIERNYLAKDYKIAGPFKSTVVDNVGYIYYGGFQGSGNQTATSLDYLLYRYQNLPGIIIDIRNNEGGSIHLVDTIVSRFVHEKQTLGYKKYKTGPGHDDFSKLYPQNFTPSGNSKYTKKPVVVLTNRKVYSAANLFATYMSQLDNVYLIGDSTGGGGGVPLYNELPNGWTVRMSTNPFLNAQKQDIEFGIAPDIKTDMNRVLKSQGIDSILETAISFLRRLNL